MALLSSTRTGTLFQPRLSWHAAEQSLTGKALLAAGASLFVALAAHVSVPLPFTPVPLTLGNMAVILVGLALTPSTAFAALVLYLLEGAAGMPVFNPGGLGGVPQLLGPTGGYLFAYPFAAAMASVTVRTSGRWIARYGSAALAATLGTAIVMLSGMSWLGVSAHLSLQHAFALGAAPFLPGELIKIAVAAGIYSAVHREKRQDGEGQL